MAPLRLVLVLCVCISASPAWAQPAATPEKPAEVTPASPEDGEPAEATPEAATEPGGEVATAAAQEKPGPRWYYRHGEASEGPFSTARVRELLQQKVINGGTLITRKAWKGAWTYPGHVDLFTDKVVWFYATAAGKKGPVNTHRLGQLLLLKLLTADNLAWRSGMEAWRPVATLPELAPPPSKLGPSPIPGDAEPAKAPEPEQAPAPAAQPEQEGSTGDAEQAPAEAGHREVEKATHAASAHRPPPRPQRTAARRMMLLLGPGMSLGFFSPGDVNRYMEQQISGATIQSGFSGMFLNIVPRISVGFAPIEYVQITAVGEIGWGPKIIEVQGSSSSSDSYHFVRYSGGGTITGHIPIKNYRFSLFGGGGALFHWMSFEEFEAGGPGARAVLGFRMYNKTFTPEIVLMFDYAHAKHQGTTSDPHTGVVTPITFDLNYTGVTIGVTFHFKVLGN